MPSSTTRPGTLAWAAPRDEPAGAEAQAAGSAAELQRDVQALGDAGQHGEVEVDDVPAREHVGIQLAHAPREAGQQLPLRTERARLLRTGPALRRQEQHLGRAAAVEPDREEPPRRRIGLDVEREDSQARRPVRGSDLGILEDEAETVRRPALAADLQRAADPAIDEVAHREADVRLVGRDAGGDEPVAQRGSVGRRGALRWPRRAGPSA